MRECPPSGSMSTEGHCSFLGGFIPHTNPRRTNIHFPHLNMYQQQRGDFSANFYHRSQESVKVFEVMKRRIELAYEQRRKSEINRMQKTNRKVMPYLEQIPLTKNVTLTIEVPSAEYACMMERMEAWCNEDSIPQIMQDTDVIIQFPDLLPDIRNAADFVNRVTLTGSLPNVEQARIRIRNFTPITISFPLRTLKSHISMKDVKNVIDKAIAEKLIDFPNLEIAVQVSQLPKDSVPLCVVRGVLSHEHDICEACVALHRLLFDAVNDNEHKTAMIYSTAIDIPTVQQLAVTGIPDGYLIRMISLETKAVIYFPTAADRHFGATIFYLYGSVHAVMRARKYIEGLLPVRLIFDVENDDLLCPVDKSNREVFLRDMEHNVTIMIQKSRLEGEQLTANDTLRNMVTIESEEYNLTNVYAVRRQLLRRGVLEKEPLIVTKDFDFFGNDFKTLIAKNNQVLAECLNNSLSETSLLLYSQLNQNMQSDEHLPMLPTSSSTINDAALLPQMHVCQEVQPYENENTPIEVPVDRDSTNQRKTEEDMNFTASPSPTVAKDQETSDEVYRSVPESMDLLRQNENKDVVTIPIDDVGGTLTTETVVPSEMEYFPNTGKASAGQSLDEHSKECNSDVITSNVDCDLTSNTTTRNILESKCLCKKLSVCMRPFVPQSQDFLSSATVAVAAAMLQNSPPQWFQPSSAAAALKSEYFGHLPRTREENIISETLAHPPEFAQISTNGSPEKIWQAKKNLPLKSSFRNENYIRKHYRNIGTTKTVDIPQRLSIRKSKNDSSVLSTLPSNRNIDRSYSNLCINPTRNSDLNRLLHQDNGSIDDMYDYRTEHQREKTFDSTVWENSRHFPSQLHYRHANSNTREFVSKRYQRQSDQNSSKFGSAMRGGTALRSARQSANCSDGYCSKFITQNSQPPWSLSSSRNSEDKIYNNWELRNMHFKRQFVNGTQVEEKGKGDRREGRCSSSYRKQKNGFVCNQFQRASEKLNDVNNITSPSKLLERTKTYVDRRKRIDVVLIDGEQSNQSEQSSQSIQKTSRPALMMKELEKYTGSYEISTKPYVNIAEKSTAKDEKIQNRIPVQDQFGNEQ